MASMSLIKFPDETGIGMISILNDDDSNISKGLRKLSQNPNRLKLAEITAVLAMTTNQNTVAGRESKRIIQEFNFNDHTVANIVNYANEVIRPKSIS